MLNNIHFKLECLGMFPPPNYFAIQKCTGSLNKLPPPILPLLGESIALEITTIPHSLLQAIHFLHSFIFRCV